MPPSTPDHKERGYLAELARTWLRSTVLALVQDSALPFRADTFTIDVNEDEGKIVLTLRLEPADLGKVIGKQGRTARAIRTLLQPRSMRDGIRYELDIVRTPATDEPPQPTHEGESK